MANKFKVIIRRTIPVRKNAEQIDGLVFLFTTGWLLTKTEGANAFYEGETAMIPCDETYPQSAPAWISSGDLKAIIDGD